MKAKFVHVLLAMLVIVAFVGIAMAEEGKEEAEHEYVGVKKCKVCHKKDGIHESWEATPHASVWDKLTAEQQKDEALLPFYTTGTTAEGDLLTGVQCEACHGPGADYKKKTIMQDAEKAAAAGLLAVDEKTCLKCHNAEAPAALAATVEGWDYAKMKEKGVHAAAMVVEGE